MTMEVLVWSRLDARTMGGDGSRLLSSAEVERKLMGPAGPSITTLRRTASTMASANCSSATAS
jgi:hypothetical protein